jgi:hypothetical protein
MPAVAQLRLQRCGLGRDTVAARTGLSPILSLYFKTWPRTTPNHAAALDRYASYRYKVCLRESIDHWRPLRPWEQN